MIITSQTSNSRIPGGDPIGVDPEVIRLLGERFNFDQNFMQKPFGVTHKLGKDFPPESDIALVTGMIDSRY